MKKIEKLYCHTDCGYSEQDTGYKVQELIDAVNELQERVEAVIEKQDIHSVEINGLQLGEPAKKEDKPPFEDRLSDLVTASRYRNAKLVDAIVALAEEHFGKEKK